VALRRRQRHSDTRNNCPDFTITHVVPSYYIEALLYAPPGCGPDSGGTLCTSSQSSLIDYGFGTSYGTTTSTQDSFMGSVTVTANGGSDAVPGSITGGYSVATTFMDSATIQRTESLDYKYPFPPPAGPDGVNPDWDDVLEVTSRLGTSIIQKLGPTAATRILDLGDQLLFPAWARANDVSRSIFPKFCAPWPGSLLRVWGGVGAVFWRP
jgi:hypothetical protein